MRELYVGLISGTSIDGIDAALVDCSQSTPQLIAGHCEPLPDTMRERIRRLCSSGDNEINQLGPLDRELGQLFAQAALNLLEKNDVSSSDILAIGSHGQTIRHQPPSEAGGDGFTLQIADPNIIVEQTGITTVADFRRRDMAAGGQGAPFAPAFHRAIAPADKKTCAFLNLGGISNLTLIHNGEIICGFDTGPANGLMDAWIREQRNLPYDDNGSWAASGTVIESLLTEWLSDPYFALPAPKSTGPELFNLGWATQSTTTFKDHAAEDVQASLLALTAQSVANAVIQLPQQPEVIYCCGGGAHNQTLLTALATLLPTTAISTTATLGIDPDFVEAALFAWLAKKNLDGEPVDMGPVTGAAKPRILGSRVTA